MDICVVNKDKLVCLIRHVIRDMDLGESRICDQ